MRTDSGLGNALSEDASLGSEWKTSSRQLSRVLLHSEVAAVQAQKTYAAQPAHKAFVPSTVLPPKVSAVASLLAKCMWWPHTSK